MTPALPWPEHARLLDLVPLAEAQRLSGLLATDCPRAECRAQPFGVVEPGEASRPRVAVYGDRWTCWACGATGGAAAYLAAVLWGWGFDQEQDALEGLQPGHAANDGPASSEWADLPPGSTAARSSVALARLAALLFARLPAVLAAELARAWAAAFLPALTAPAADAILNSIAARALAQPAEGAAHG